MKHLALIYLDVAFITALYEEMKGIVVPIKVTKSRDANGSLGLHGFFSASVGATMREQKEYPLDARGMFDELQSSLEMFPEIDLLKTKDQDLPELFWVNGVFGIVQSSMLRGDKENASGCHFQFVPFPTGSSRMLNLIPNDTYFSSGYDQLYRHGQILACEFAIRARLLVRLIFFDKYYAVAAPMLIIKKNSDCP